MDKETFDRQATVVASAWDILDKEQEWKKILDHYNLGFPYAHLVTYRMGTLNKEGKQQVIDTYNFLISAMNVEDDEEYYSFWDVIAARNKNEGAA